MFGPPQFELIADQNAAPVSLLRPALLRADPSRWPMTSAAAT